MDLLPGTHEGASAPLPGVPEDTHLLAVPSAERFREIVERMPGIAYIEANSDPFPIAYVSPRITDVLGYEAGRWWDRRFWLSLIHPDDLDMTVAEDERSWQDHERFDAVYRMRAADGTWRWFHDEALFVDDDEGGHWFGLLTDVTASKETELQLRDVETRHRAILEHLPAVPYLDSVGPGWGSIYIGPQVESTLGLPPIIFSDERHWAAALHPEDRDATVGAVRAGIASGEPYELEYRMTRPDGSTVWIRDQAWIVRDPDGEPLYVQGLYSNVTDEKLREGERDDAIRRFQVLADRLPGIVYIEDPFCDDMLYMSPRYEEWFGYTPEQRMADPGLWPRLLHPDDRERAVALSQEAERTGEDLAMDYRMIARDGTVRWIRDETTLVRQADGAPSFWMGVMFDITELREAEARFAESAKRFQTLVEQLPAITYLDPLAPEPVASLYVSPQIREILGIEPAYAEANDDWWESALHPDDRERAMLESHAADGTLLDYQTEYRLIARDGHVVWVRDEARLVRGEDGRPRYWQGLMYDITAAKQAEQELARALELEQESVRRLQQADDVKNAFLTAVSHDLRTPLAAILGSAVTLENEEELGISAEERRSLIRAVANKTRRLSQLVTDLLDIDRLSRGVVEPHREPLDVGSLVARLVAESDLFDESRTVSVECMPVEVPVDASMVGRIVENLLANTAKHAPPGSTVWVRVASDVEGALIVIEDDGPGVPPELRESLFRPFERGPSANPQSPGVGIGLSLVVKFAELHGGRAWVEERPGGGASFKVLLPSHSASP
jgi:PAS domain S-box-containing protein